MMAINNINLIYILPIVSIILTILFYFFFEKIKLINLHLDSKIYVLGIFVVVLYTIPFVNLLAPTIANLLFSHLILQSNKSIFK